MATAATPIFANPGQTVRLIIQTLDINGQRADGYIPRVVSILFPDLTIAADYPQDMTKIDTGLYAYGLVIPTGVTSLGTFVVSIYSEGGGSVPIWDTFMIQVARPFGNSSVSPL